MTPEDEIPPIAEGDQGDQESTGTTARGTDSTAGTFNGKADLPSPVNFNPEWFHFFVAPDRSPLGKKKTHPDYWAGKQVSWDMLTELLPRRVPALLCSQSNLVILDCDVSQIYVKNADGSMSFGEHHGLSDLERVVRELGHTMDELNTYRVRTRSGGVHLYFKQNPACTVSSKVHRKNWLIDVKASQNTWVVSPPAEGYVVVDDVPVIELPLWLATFIQSRLNKELEAKNPRPSTLPDNPTAARISITTDGGLLAGYVASVTKWIEDSNVNGGWNDTIYNGTHYLVEAGLSLDEIEKIVLEAAEPANDTERDNALRSVHSAWDKQQSNGEVKGFIPDYLPTLDEPEIPLPPLPTIHEVPPDDDDEAVGESVRGVAFTAPETETGDRQELPEAIEVSGDVGEMAYMIRWVINDHNYQNPNVFRNAGRIVRVGRDDFGSPIMIPHTHPSFVEWLSTKIKWFKVSAKGVISFCAPPEIAVVSVMQTIDAVNVAPVLQRISSIPFYGADGVLVNERGYNAGSRAWYEPIPGETVPPVPAKPTQDQLEAALSVLKDDLLSDFPFSQEADLAGALALIIEPFVRDLIKGSTPIHLVEAPTQGTGKSLLAKLCTSISQPPTKETTPNRLSTDDAENRKSITAMLLEGRQIIFYDNVSHFIDSDALAQALTTSTWSDRTLGKNSNVELAVRATWVMTSNNARYNRDFPRRISLCRLDLSTTNETNEVVEHPETRTGFRHPDVLVWARAHHSELVAAVLTVVNSWLAHGQTPWSGRPLGSFECWSAVIGGILENAGVKGFLDNRHLLVAGDDDDRDAEVEFVESWWAMFGSAKVKPTDLIQVSALCGDFLNLEKANGDRGASSRTGRWLRKAKDRVIGDYIIRDSGSRTWTLVRREIA